MSVQLKKFINERDETGIIELINKEPELLDQTDENGASTLMLLAYSGLVKSFDQAKLLKKTFTFHESIVCGMVENITKIVASDPSIANKHSPDGFTPLSLAAFFDQEEIALLILESGGDPNLKASNSAGVNALHSAVAKNNLSLCRLFLENGADPNIPQMQNVTSLHSAAHRGNAELVKLLVEYGADINAKMENGDSALSISQRDGHKDIIAFLHSKKAD